MKLLSSLTSLPAAVVLALTLASCGKQSAEQSNSANTATVSISNMPASKLDAGSSMFQDLQGRGLEIASFAGKKVFLNYWATWCAPCIRELPALARAAAMLEDENYVFLLASDESPETIKAFIADRGFTGNFIKLNGFFGGHGIDAVPSSMIYDEQGKLLYTWTGAHEWDSEEMLELIRHPETIE